MASVSIKPTQMRPTDPEWLKRALRDLGLKEVTGPKHSVRVLEMFKKAGHPEIKNDETAWCAAAVNCWLAEAGEKGTGSLMARSFTKYGKEIDRTKPVPRGTIVVFPRTGSPTFGHVALVLEDTGNGILTILGGNQSNSVSVQYVKRASAIAFRWPNTVKNSVTVKTVSTAIVATGAAVAAEKAAHAPSVTELSPYLDLLPYVSQGSLALGAALLVYVLFRHYRKNIRA